MQTAKPSRRAVPLQVSLADLAGIPEYVDIVCAGRVAVMSLRTQRIRFEGQDVTASKFEALCGKGDAKKWKCSIWQYNPTTGEPIQMMQDWLNEKKLDRKALTDIANNWYEYNEWMAYKSSLEGGDADAGRPAVPGTNHGTIYLCSGSLLFFLGFFFWILYSREDFFR